MVSGAFDYDWAGFRELVGEYERFLTQAPQQDLPLFQELAQSKLARLYYEATVMRRVAVDFYSDTGGDEAWAARDEEHNPEYDQWFETWQSHERSLAAYLGDRNRFFVAGDPSEQECYATSLSDGLADVLSDLQAGAAHFDAGRLPEAMWEWTFRFDHWGDHALDALKVLHWRVGLGDSVG